MKLAMQLSVVTIALCLVALCYTFGIYDYQRISSTDDVFRVNRLTGVKQFSTPEGWKTERQLASEAIQARRNLEQTTNRVAEDARAGRIATARIRGQELLVTYRSGAQASVIYPVFNEDLLSEASYALRDYLSAEFVSPPAIK